MRPTHIHRKTGALVFPHGYPARDLKPLPDGYWDAHDLEAATAAMRAERDARLKASDEFMWPDRPLTDAQRAAWISYRQALRDIPDTADPAAPKWPKQPKD